MNHSHNILLLEDDEMLAQTLCQLLTQEGYKVRVVYDGKEALEATYEEVYDMYLFDVNVPLLDGADALGLLRDAGDGTPAFFITALRDIASVSRGFQSGCDDYIKKPFDMDELLIRIKAILRRKNPAITYGDLVFDLLANRVYRQGEEIDLGMVEKAVLALLLRNVGLVVEKEAFFDHMNRPSDAGLRVLISKLKKTFGFEVTNSKGIGYRLEKL